MQNTTFHQVAMAGAGCGKTYSLVESYLSALFGFDQSGEKKRPSQILALTFTQKAANEMRQRVALRLQSFLSPENLCDDPLVLRAQENNLSIPKPETIKLLLRSLGNANISTFHSFCANFLRENALSLNLSHDFSILTPLDEKQLARAILRPIIVEKVQRGHEGVKSLVSRFSLDTQGESFGLLDSLIAFYDRLHENGFTLNHLENALAKKIDKSTLEKNIFHIEQSLKDFCACDVSEKTAQKLSAISQALEKVKESFLELNQNHLALSLEELQEKTKGNFGPREVRQDLNKNIYEFSANCVDYFCAPDEQAIFALIKEFETKFFAHKKEHEVLSYADLLLLCKKSLQENATLRKKLKARFSFVLVDEYQDTSPLQEELLALLIESKNAHENFAHISALLDEISLTDGASLFAVGDKKQSIYGFRGAKVELFDRLVDKLKNQPEQNNFSKKLLVTNRRSGRRVIDLVNLVSHHALSEQGFCDNDYLQAFHDHEGCCELWINPENTELDQAATLALGLKQFLDHKQNILPKDVCVLIRRIKSAKAIKDCLKKQNIDAKIVGGEGFFQRQEVVDVLSAFKVALDQSCESALLNFVRSPFLLARDQEVFDFLNFCKLQGTINFLSLKEFAQENFSAPTKKRLQKFLEWQKSLAQQLECAELGLVFDRLCIDCEFYLYLGMLDHKEACLANVKKLRSFFSLNEKALSVFVDELFDNIKTNFSESLAESSKSKNQVSIMTIHQSKGLEFNTLILADCESTLPNNRDDFIFDQDIGIGVSSKLKPIHAIRPSSTTQKQWAKCKIDRAKEIIYAREQKEMARLLYVALTRAKENLFVVAKRESFLKGAKAKSLLGLFLRAHEREKEKFLQLCPIKTIINKNELSNPEISSESENVQEVKNIALARWPSTVTRYFSSMLACEDESAFGKYFVSEGKKQTFFLDGNLAHELIQRAGEIIQGLRVVSEQEIFDILNFCARSMGVEHEKNILDQTCQAVTKSLLLLHESLHRAEQIIFEMPLVARPKENIVIEGYSDLVLFFDDFIGVLEFKSGSGQLRNSKTYLQIFAYAHALRKKYMRPIKYCAHLLGQEEQIFWQDFSPSEEKLLIKACV